MGAVAPDHPGPRDLARDVVALRAALDGEVDDRGALRAPQEPGRGRDRTWPQRSTVRTIGLVATPASVADVQVLVRFADRHRLRVVPRMPDAGAFAPGGGPEGSLLVELDRLGSVTVDPAGRRARVGAGASWRHVASAASPHGLVAPAGSSSWASPVADTLGGGLGWLARRHGMACTAVLALEVVTADGDVRRCDATHDPDLFWALRGGGGGLGLVTAIETALFPVTTVRAGVLTFPVRRAAEVLRAWAGWTTQAPDTVTSVARLLPPGPGRGGRVRVADGGAVELEVCLLGDERGRAALVAPLRALGPVADTVATIPAVGLAQLPRAGSLGRPSAVCLLAALPDDAVAGLVAAAVPAPGEAPVSVEVRHLGGAVAASSPDHGALDRLDGRYLVTAAPVGGDAVPASGCRAALARVVAATAQTAGGGCAVVAGIPSPSVLLPPDRRARVRAIGAAVDPDGRFPLPHRSPQPTSGRGPCRRTPVRRRPDTRGEPS